MASSRNVGPGPCASSPRNALLRAPAVTWKVNWKVRRSGSQTEQGACRSRWLALPSGNALLPWVMEQWWESCKRVLGRAGMCAHAHMSHSSTHFSATACQANRGGFAEDPMRAHQNAGRYNTGAQGTQELTGETTHKHI